MDRHHTFLTEIGEGAYAKVYAASDQSGSVWAIKQLQMTHEGIPSLSEIAIMTTIQHPNLCSAKDVYTTRNKKVNIVQEKAICDLKTYTRNQLYDISLIRKWLFDVTQAVGVLHYLGIIHADIKGSNVLYYDDNDVRLGDFSLSVLNPTRRMCHGLACTYSHSPPEALCGEGWNESLDIWSLGCFYYEVAFGSLLFPHQGKLKDKRELKLRYYNSIAAWKGMGLMGTGSEYRTVNLHPCYHLDSYKPLVDLIERMLIFDYRNRPTITSILNDTFFTGLCSLPTQTKDFILSDEEDVFVYEHILMPSKDLYTDRWNRVVQLAAQIYDALRSVSKRKDQFRIGACWIAGKVVCRLPPALNTILEQSAINKMEITICGYLGFCFPIHHEK